MADVCGTLRAFGEVAEWSKAHAWKVCIRQRIEGSNPSFSAIQKYASLVEVFFRMSEKELDENL